MSTSSSELSLIHSGCSKNRSFVRKVATWFPLRSAARIQFQEELLRSVRDFCEDATMESECDMTTDESIRQMWYNPTPVTLADIVWLIRDEGEANIKLRTQLYGLDPVTASTPLPTRHQRHTGVSQCGAHGHGPVDPFHAQTPIKTLSRNATFSRECDAMMSPVPGCFHTPDQAAMAKISQLEQELFTLRQQLANIAIKQETTHDASMASVDGNMASFLSLNVPATPPPAAAPPPPGIPPPPPPPPPPIISLPQTTVMDLIKERRSNSNKSGVKKDSRPDLSDVLKGLGTVKLKAVKRSPGGTPVRQKPRLCETNDPAAMIAQALKKKFAQCNTRSPDTDKENVHVSGSCSPSPRKPLGTPPGPHLLKPSVRRQFKRRSNNHAGLSEISPNLTNRLQARNS